MNKEERRKAYLALPEDKRKQCSAAAVRRIASLPMVLGIAALGIAPGIVYSIVADSSSQGHTISIIVCSALVTVLLLVTVMRARAPRICDEELEKIQQQLTDNS